MLSRIFIQNFALIDRLEIHLGSGLQVITGETGAGKSIILGALRLILGERADLKAIANTDSKSIVETEFRLAPGFKYFFEENDLDFEANTIIRREILPSGKSRAFINDVPATLDLLRELSSKLIDIHSQFETANLFSEAYQFSIIDGLGGGRPDLAAYRGAYADYQKRTRDLALFKKQLAEGNKEADYNQFLLAELEDLRLDEMDYEQLQNQLAVQENAGMITENLAAVSAKFHLEEVGIQSALTDARQRLARVAEVSPDFAELSERLDQSVVEIKDIIAEMESLSGKIEADPVLFLSLNEVNNRVNALFVKHNVDSVEALKEIRDRLAEQQNSFADLEENIAGTERQIAEIQSRLLDLSQKITAARIKSAKVFKAKTEILLRQLGLEKASIEAEISVAADFNYFGKDKIEILFQANAGFPMKPIQSAISGGERSRVMLAVKKIMAENSALPTLILDEIDTGVSGKVADEMGKVMREMSKDMQLIVITHLAQVAAKGADNYKVLKQEVAGKTQSTIIPLSQEEKLTEIAQLLSGSKITGAALQQARELMQ